MHSGVQARASHVAEVQSVCGSGKDTVGTVAHMASLVAGEAIADSKPAATLTCKKLSKGFCYVILFLPPMGDGSYFGSDRPGQSSFKWTRASSGHVCYHEPQTLYRQLRDDKSKVCELGCFSAAVVTMMTWSFDPLGCGSCALGSDHAVLSFLQKDQ